MWLTLYDYVSADLDNVNSATFSSLILTFPVTTLQLSALFFLKHPNMFLPQGLCSGCLLSLERSCPTFSHGFFISFLTSSEEQPLTTLCISTTLYALTLFYFSSQHVKLVLCPLLFYFITVEIHGWMGGISFCVFL